MQTERVRRTAQPIALLPALRAIGACQALVVAKIYKELRLPRNALPDLQTPFLSPVALIKHA
jgi:hypothetical protein